MILRLNHFIHNLTTCKERKKYINPVIRLIINLSFSTLIRQGQLFYLPLRPKKQKSDLSLSADSIYTYNTLMKPHTIEAIDSGFNNIRSFYRLFRDKYGMTLLEYRDSVGSKK